VIETLQLVEGRKYRKGHISECATVSTYGLGNQIRNFSMATLIDAVHVMPAADNAVPKTKEWNSAVQ